MELLEAVFRELLAACSKNIDRIFLRALTTHQTPNIKLGTVN
jgi:hypothetical protein